MSAYQASGFKRRATALAQGKSPEQFKKFLIARKKELGNIARTDRPTQVNNEPYWSKVECGMSSTMALKTDRTLWAWGNKDEGQLGLSETTHVKTPMRIQTGK